MVDALLGAAIPAPLQSPAALAERPLPFAAAISLVGDGRETARSTPSWRPSVPELPPTSPSGSLSPASYAPSRSPTAHQHAGGGSAPGSRTSSIAGSRSPSAGRMLSGRPSHAGRLSARASGMSSVSSQAPTDMPSARSSRGASLPPLPAAAAAADSGGARGRPRLRGQHSRSFAPRSASARGMAGGRRRPGSARAAVGRNRLAAEAERAGAVPPDPRVRAEAQLILQEQLRKHLGLVQEESIEEALPLGAGFRSPGGAAQGSTLMPGRLPPMDPDAVNEAVRRLALIGGAPPVDIDREHLARRASSSAPVTPSTAAPQTAEAAGARDSTPRALSDHPGERRVAATASAPCTLETVPLIDPAESLSALARRDAEAAGTLTDTVSDLPPSMHDSATTATGGPDDEFGTGSGTAMLAGAIVAATVHDATPTGTSDPQSSVASGGRATVSASGSSTSSELSLHHAHHVGSSVADGSTVEGAVEAAEAARPHEAEVAVREDSGAVTVSGRVAGGHVSDSTQSTSLILPPLRAPPPLPAAQPHAQLHVPPP